MKLLYPLLFLLINACQSLPPAQSEKPIECVLRDSISFDRHISMDDPKLAQFLHPIQTIDSIILIHKIIPETLITAFAFDTIYTETWSINKQLLKFREVKSNFQFTPDITLISQFYIISDCSWYFIKERRRFVNDTLIDKSILNFNDLQYVNCIYTKSPEPDRFFSRKKLTTHPIINADQVANYYYGRIYLIENSKTH
ncbi:MAG: hypothetical protein GQ574_21545 [Crocinitomix sp.]|nr:hypothetical protein [Crocinitomix sp.]